MSNLAIRVLPEPVRTLGFASISGAYAGIGTAFANPVHWFMVQNLTDVPVMISWDGVNDAFPLPNNGYVIMDVGSNKTQTGGAFYVAQGTRFYAKQIGAVAPTVLGVYLSIFYGYNG